ncbi:hypothetical protein HPB50_028129 [Hyalomma asiaticum]|nr:hypothetical protein HPB50_028129 [Hyalomma asiaticum]
MQRSPTELVAVFVNDKGDGVGEDRSFCEIQVARALRESGLAGDVHVSIMEPPAEEQPHQAADVAHEDQGGEVETTSSASSGSTADGSSTASTSSSPAGEEAGVRPHLVCCLCPEDVGAPVEALFRCPCRCPDTFVHRSCLEQLLYIDPEGAACPVCGVRYPVRRCTKALWRWFWEKESREDAILFLANLVFSLGNMGVLAMAWLYVLFEYTSKSWLSTASLATALFVLTVLWVAFGCLRFSILFTALVHWRRQNTTLKVLLTDKTVAQA